MKINCDGSYGGNPGNSGGGGIIQDSNRMVQGAFSTNYGYDTNNE